MIPPITFAAIILGLVTLQRLGELILANSNTRRLLARGAIEKYSAHYPFIVALHALWLLGLWLLAWNAAVNIWWLSVFVLLQALRVWVIVTLGERWTTRIIVLAGVPRIRAGPYRYLSHPNYAIVIAEIAVLPLVFGLWTYAIVFSLLNALLLFVRIRAEAKALDDADTAPAPR